MDYHRHHIFTDAPNWFSQSDDKKLTHLLLTFWLEDTEKAIKAFLFLPKNKNGTQKMKSDNVEGNHVLS